MTVKPDDRIPMSLPDEDTLVYVRRLLQGYRRNPTDAGNKALYRQQNNRKVARRAKMVAAHKVRLKSLESGSKLKID